MTFAVAGTVLWPTTGLPQVSIRAGNQLLGTIGSSAKGYLKAQSSHLMAGTARPLRARSKCPMPLETRWSVCTLQSLGYQSYGGGQLVTRIRPSLSRVSSTNSHTQLQEIPTNSDALYWQGSLGI